MRITPLDVRKQEFRKAMRGLDGEEVYAFLSTVADEYESVLNDNKALRERLLELDDKVQEYRSMEKTLRNTLLTAERVTVEAKDNARREGILIVKEAQIEADKALRDIRTEEMTLRQQVAQLRSQRDAFLAKMRVVAESHLNFIESAQDDFVDDDTIHSRTFGRKTYDAGPETGSDADLFDDSVNTAIEDVASAAGTHREDAPPLTAHSDVTSAPVVSSFRADVPETAPAPTPVPAPVAPPAPEVSPRQFRPNAGDVATAPRGESTPSIGSAPSSLSDGSDTAIADINAIIERMQQGQRESLEGGDGAGVAIPPQSVRSTAREEFAPLRETMTATVEPSLHKPAPPQGVPVGRAWSGPESPLESPPPVPRATDVTGEWDIEKIRRDLAGDDNPDIGD